jgi:hypothetical protein
MDKIIKTQKNKAGKDHACDASIMIREEIKGSCNSIEEWKEVIPKCLHSTLDQVMIEDNDKIKKGEIYERLTILSDEAQGYITIYQKPLVGKILRSMWRSGYIDWD